MTPLCVYYTRYAQDQTYPNIPKIALYFNSDIDRMVRDAWTEQEAVEWNQILKGRLSTRWGKYQAL